MEIKEFQQKLQDIQRLAVNNGRKIGRADTGRERLFRGLS